MPEGPYTPIARVVRTHGVNGELSVTPVVEVDLDTFAAEDVWVVPPVGLAAPYRIESVRPGPKGVLVRLDRVSDVETARQYAGTSLVLQSSLVPEDALVEEFDPLGYEVVDKARGPLGRITDVIVTGANDVWTVHGDLGEILIPVIDDVVLEIDEGDRTVSVALLPGLVEE